MSEEQAPRIRSRIPTGTPQPAAQPAAQGQPAQRGGDDWMKSGARAREIQQTELQRNQEREKQRAEGIWMPWRFWLPVGKQVELVILDSEPGPCFYEHQLQNPSTGKWDIYEGCPKEFEVCPLCDGAAGGKESYYVMMLTAMVLDPYINKNGVTVPHSRKLLAVKTNDQPTFLRRFDQEGTLRGTQWLMSRDTKNDSNIGRPEFLQRHAEEDIIASFGHPPVTAQDGRVLKQANADCHAFPYAKLWSRPSGEDLRRRYGGVAPMGSAQDIQTAAGGTRIQPRGGNTAGGAGGVDHDLDDDVPF
jgi:hypothetical protein